MKKIYKFFFIFGIIILLILIISLFIQIENQNVEQYYIENQIYLENILDNNFNKKNFKIISEYSEYVKIFSNDYEVTELLKRVINENFFDSNSLIILEDSTESAGGIEGYISKLKIKENKASITIRRNSNYYGCIAETTRTYFLPINNKNITQVDKNLIFPSDISNSILIICVFILVNIILLRVIINNKN